MKLNYKEVLDYQKFWEKSSNLTDKQKEGYRILSNKLIERAKENNDEIDDVVLLYPEDYAEDHRIFAEFASAMGANVCVRPEGGTKMCGVGLNYEVDVE